MLLNNPWNIFHFFCIFIPLIQPFPSEFYILWMEHPAFSRFVEAPTTNVTLFLIGFRLNTKHESITRCQLNDIHKQNIRHLHVSLSQECSLITRPNLSIPPPPLLWLSFRHPLITLVNRGYTGFIECRRMY